MLCRINSRFSPVVDPQLCNLFALRAATLRKKWRLNAGSTLEGFLKENGTSITYK